MEEPGKRKAFSKALRSLKLNNESSTRKARVQDSRRGFLVIGLLFAVLGSIKYFATLKATDERIYATAHIVKIDERNTGDPEFPVEYTTFVEYEMNGQNITAVLNTYNSSFKIGKEIDIYYFENDLQMVYEVGSDAFYIIFASVGLLFAILGAILILKKRTA